MTFKAVLKQALGIFFIASLCGMVSATAWAKNQDLVNQGYKMMVQGKEVAKKGVATIRKGQEMYLKIAREKGFAAEIAPGNEKIEAGLSQARQGGGYLEMGQKMFEANKGKNQEIADAGLEKMVEGANLVQEALKIIQDGVKMNNDVLRAKNLEAQVEAPSRTILKGVESGLTGIAQFLKGQRLVMENR